MRVRVLIQAHPAGLLLVTAPSQPRQAPATAYGGNFHPLLGIGGRASAGTVVGIWWRLCREWCGPCIGSEGLKGG